MKRRVTIPFETSPCPEELKLNKLKMEYKPPDVLCADAVTIKTIPFNCNRITCDNYKAMMKAFLLREEAKRTALLSK